VRDNDETSDGPRPVSAEPVKYPTVTDLISECATIDERVIATMVRDAAGGAELGIVLKQIRDLATSPAPTPSAELAALLVDGLPPTPPTTRRVSRRYRAFLGTFLVAVMGVTAVGAAVADDSFRHGAQLAISNLINTLSPVHPPAPVPTQPVGYPRPSTEPTPALPSRKAPSTDSGDSEHADRIPGPTEPGNTAIITPEAGPTESDKTAPGEASPPQDAPDSTPDRVPSTGGEGASTKPPENG
jgi:hypothetical protein